MYRSVIIGPVKDRKLLIPIRCTTRNLYLHRPPRGRLAAAASRGSTPHGRHRGNVLALSNVRWWLGDERPPLRQFVFSSSNLTTSSRNSLTSPLSGASFCARLVRESASPRARRALSVSLPCLSA